MKLTKEEIRSALTGAVLIEEKDGSLFPYRFTEEQMELYANRPRYGKKQRNTAGIRLSFQTDSSSLFLKLNLTPTSSFHGFAVDVFVDGVFLDAIQNLDEENLPDDYLKKEYPQGVFSKEFSLGEGPKQVTVYFPFACVVEIMEVSLEDGSFCTPVKPPKKLLAFGDSITQGYITIHPSRRYASQLADLLNAEEFNKGVGGETFFPELAESKESFDPDYIIVAYGTNDWGKSAAPQDLPLDCTRFLETVSRLYPKAQIFAISPIWRGDYLTFQPPFGPFQKVAELIRSVADSLPNVTFIDGFPLVPGETCYYADLKIHPNDQGFDHYAKNLYTEIKKHIN